MTRTADIVVVGAGIVGSSIALELSRRQLSVIVVDKAPGPGLGSTSASSAVVRFNYTTWDGMAAAWESKHRWEKWSDHLGFVDPAGMATFHRCGLVFLDSPLLLREQMCGLFDRGGIPYESWTADELAVRVPGIEVGSFAPPKRVDSDEFFADPRGRLGAIFTPDAGYVSDPQLATANLARAAEHRGAEFVFRRTVTSMEHRDVWRIGLDSGDSVEAPIVVNAAGPWSAKLNALANIEADFTVTHAALRQEVHQVAQPASWSAHGVSMPIIADLDLGTYIRPEGTHSLLLGGTEPECDPLEWLDDPDESSDRPTRVRFEAQVYRGVRRFPEVRVPNQTRGVAGVYDATSDWAPIYDRTTRPGFYVAIGTSGNQFKNGPLVGSILDTLITEIEAGHDHDASPLQLVAQHTGHVINLGSFSRRRVPNSSTGTAMG